MMTRTRILNRTLSWLAPLAVALTTLQASAQHPNLERGFAVDKAFQVGEIDHVNLFNGNVTLTIPLGAKSTISEQLSLALTATYNSKVWEMRTPAGSTHKQMLPDDLSNAGLGWLVSLGRLLGTAQLGVFSYQGPDGAIHQFHESLHAGDPVTTGFRYSRDGSYLRLRQSGTHYFVEFPNGIAQEFEPWQDGTATRFRLWATRDPHGNYFSIDYSVANEWTIKDQYDRKTIVRFAATPAPPPGRTYPSTNYETAVDSITIPSFNGQTSKYQFTYEAQTLRRAWCGDGEPEADDKYAAAPLLKKIALWHGGTLIGEYLAEYDVTIQPPATGSLPESCKAGTITSLKLPTQATIRWTYGTYSMPGDCRSELATDRSAGVTMRKYDAPTSGQFTPDQDGTWTYSPALTQEPNTGGFICGNQTFPGGPPPGEMTNTVTSPSGDQTVHYFSVWQIGRTDGPHGETRDEFALPFSRREAAAGDTMFLSTRICKGLCTSSPNPQRTTYVAYERDFLGGQFEANRRVVASKTVFNDDANHYLQLEYSDFDGVGHYRNVTTSGDFGDGTVMRTTRTAYNVRDSLVSSSSSVLNTGTYNSADGTGFTLPPTGHPWILNTFSSVVAIQELDSRTQYACFDPLLGDLRATRVLAGVTSASTDLIKVFDRSADPDENGSSPGFITMESFYGGDKAPLLATTKTALCDYVNATVATDKPRPLGFRAKHTYAYGSRAKSTFYEADGVTAMPFKSLDLDIDISGLASTVRDTAGVATAYEYDESGRLKKITPPGMAAITYTYTSATSSVRAKVTTTQPSTTGTVTREVHFDSLGRPVVEKRTVDSSLLRSRTTAYNAMGWKTSVGEWGGASATTFSNFDAFGRPQTAMSPDGSTMSMSYTGERETIETRSFQSPVGEQTTTVTMLSDVFGRLREVSERSGPTTFSAWNGNSVTTKYSFDLADHLTKVEISPTGGTTQLRTFTYDGRGWLTTETQPELDGTVSYTYDGLGHVVSKSFSTASAFDLTYTYDAAGRLTDVFSKFGAGFRLSKNFAFGNSGTGKGRLVKAKRYNYRPSSSDHYLVTEDYAHDADGRISSRDTSITRVISGASTLVRTFTQGKTYNDLALPETITYPQCVNCGSSARTMTPGYTRGVLTSIPGFVTDIDRAASGMTTRVVHSNGISDVTTVPVTGEARPDSITFEGFCTPPAITTQPPDQDVEQSAMFIINVPVTGTSPTYQWWKRPASTSVWSSIPGATSEQLNTSVTEETFFHLIASNDCGSVTSRDVRITVFDLPTIDIPPASATIAGGATRQLSVTASGSAPLSYQWYQGTSGNTSQPIAAPAGTQSSYTTPPLWATTSYWVRVSNSHGSVNSPTATITVVLAAPTGVVATRVTNTQILVTWNVSPGAGRYRLERRSGSGFAFRATITNPAQTSFADTTVLANKTYVYRLFAEDSSGGSNSIASNQDLATTIDFASVQPNALVAVNPLDQILAGVNALRSAASSGATPFTWASLVSPPLPGNGTVVGGSSISALRAQLNLARGSLGFPNWSFTDSSPTLIKAIHITQLQDALR